MTDLNVIFHGTSAAIPTVKRGLSAIEMRRGGDVLLFDCGEGTQRQMMKHTGLKAPRAIFITHGHGDHWGGLSGLLSTLDMQEFTGTLPVYVPLPCVGKIRASLEAGGGLPPWAEITPFLPGEIMNFESRNGRYSVRSFPTEHSKGSQGYVLEEPTRPGRFDPNLAVLSGIEPGPDFARLQAGETVKGLRPEDVIGPERRGRKIVYTGDTRPRREFCEVAENANLLIHEATFEYADSSRAESTKHSTSEGAAGIAQWTKGLERLILTHFSPRSNVSTIVQEASRLFSPVEAARDGMNISIPLEN